MSFSIAMATYNGERFLAEQLASLAAQTLLPAELVVCDDLSSDGTESVVRSFARSAPFDVRFESNGRRLGVSDNFLRAASLCRSEWIAFCDQDDVWLPQKLATVHALISCRPAVLLVAHRATLVDEELRPSGEMLHVPPVRRVTVAPPLARGFWSYPYGFTMSFSARLLRAGPLEGRPIESHDRWIAALAGVLGETAYLPEPLALYRRHGRNVSVMQPPIAPLESLKLAGMEQELSSAAALLDRLSAWLERGARAASEPDAGRLAGGAEVFARQARRMTARAALWREGEPGARQLLRYARLLAAGGYSAHRLGGLGLRAALKDAAHLVLRGRRGSA